MSRSGAIVRVLYDFEYGTDGGKQVWMKEGEKLLLLRKTNLDWWQVIRKGDRRPFYAPATYVEELISPQPADNSIENGSATSPESGYTMTCPKLSAGDEWEQRRLWAQKELIAELEKKNSRASTGSGSDSSSSVASRILKDLNRTSTSSLPSKPKPAPRTSTTKSANYSKVTLGSCKEPVIENALPRQLSGSLEEMAQQIQFSTVNDDEVFEDAPDSKYIYDLPPKPVPAPRKCDAVPRVPPCPLAFANPLYSESDEDVPLNSPHPIMPAVQRRATPSSHGGETTEDSLPLSDGDASERDASVIGSSDENLVDSMDQGMVPSNPVPEDAEPPPPLRSPESRQLQRESSLPPPPPPVQDLLPAPSSFAGPLPPPSSPVYANFPLKSPPEPPSPIRYEEAPTKVLANGWEEFVHPTGRPYYYNPDTGEKRWKPPRKNLYSSKQQQAPESSRAESPTQPCCHLEEGIGTIGNVYFVVPPGWREDFDDITGQVYYIHPTTGTRVSEANISPGVIPN